MGGFVLYDYTTKQGVVSNSLKVRNALRRATDCLSGMTSTRAFDAQGPEIERLAEM